MKKNRYYTIWVGAETGVVDNWTDCQLLTKNFPGAIYKGYPTKEEAVAAYRSNPDEEMDVARAIAVHIKEAAKSSYTLPPGVNPLAVAVDGACAGNPGKMEYRAVRVSDGREIFHRGADGSLIGTNNIAEYLAIIHMGALLLAKGRTDIPIYSDSRTALSWVRRGHSKSTLESTPRTAKVLELLERADQWIASHKIQNPLIKWDTDLWGEIPADFGRKN